MRKMTGWRSRSCGRSEGPPVAWEDSMEEVSPEEDGAGSDGEGRAFLMRGNAGRGPTVGPWEL